MRKYFTGFIAAVFAMTAILPLRVLAAGDEVRLKEEGNNVNVSVSVFFDEDYHPRSVRLAVTMWKMARSRTRGRSITDR